MCAGFMPHMSLHLAFYAVLNSTRWGEAGARLGWGIAGSNRVLGQVVAWWWGQARPLKGAETMFSLGQRAWSSKRSNIT